MISLPLSLAASNAHLLRRAAALLKTDENEDATILVGFLVACAIQYISEVVADLS